MEFYESLKTYLSNEFIEDLKMVQQERKTTSSLILNTNKMSEEQFVELFPKISKNSRLFSSFSYKKEEYEFGKSYLFDNGLYYIIDKSSQVTTSFLELEDNDLVLDLCAAPGGKTISLALRYPNVNFISNDISQSRSLILSSNIEKLGLSNVIVTSSDFSMLYTKFLNSFDAIILDAPCSGSAMFRKDEEMLKDWNYKKVLNLSTTQQSLIEIAFSMLKEGGTLIYSTCSFSYEEDENVILNFLKNHDDAELINLPNNSSFYKSEALPEAIHIFPNLFDGEGQFICYIKKKGIKKINSINKAKNTETFKGFILNLPYIDKIKDKYYGYKTNFDLKNLHIIRKGLFIGEEIKSIFKPSFHLAHFLDSSISICLTEEEKNSYIKGFEIKKNLNLKNGYYVVSHLGINLGFVKYVDGKLKNFYPKGLRH